MLRLMLSRTARGGSVSVGSKGTMVGHGGGNFQEGMTISTSPGGAFQRGEKEGDTAHIQQVLFQALRKSRRGENRYG